MGDDFQEWTESNIFACCKARSGVRGETERGELKALDIRVPRMGMGVEEGSVTAHFRVPDKAGRAYTYQ